MKRAGLAASIFIGMLMFPIGYIAAQEKAESTGSKFAALYVKAADNPKQTQEAIALFMERYEKQHTAAQGALQDVQVSSEASYHAQMLQVAQNRRIIELLETIAAKK